MSVVPPPHITADLIVTKLDKSVSAMSGTALKGTSVTTFIETLVNSLTGVRYDLLVNGQKVRDASLLDVQDGDKIEVTQIPKKVGNQHSPQGTPVVQSADITADFTMTKLDRGLCILSTTTTTISRVPKGTSVLTFIAGLVPALPSIKYDLNVNGQGVQDPSLMTLQDRDKVEIITIADPPSVVQTQPKYCTGCPGHDKGTPCPSDEEECIDYEPKRDDKEEQHLCTCSSQQVLAFGCKCGGK